MWKEMQISGPSRRSGHAMAYDPIRRRTVLFGGGWWDGKVSTSYRDTWEWDGRQWTRMQ